MSKVDSIWLGSFRESPWLLFLHKLGNAVKWLRPKRAIIFGSAVTNGFDARDFDLLIVSDYFLKTMLNNKKIINIRNLIGGCRGTTHYRRVILA